MKVLEKIISELVELSQPNNLEKTIFIFPEGVLSNVYLEDLKNYSYIFSRELFRTNIKLL